MIAAGVVGSGRLKLFFAFSVDLRCAREGKVDDDEVDESAFPGFFSFLSGLFLDSPRVQDFFRFAHGSNCFFESGFYVTTRLIRFDAKFGGGQKKGKSLSSPRKHQHGTHHPPPRPTVDAV